MIYVLSSVHEKTLQLHDDISSFNFAPFQQWLSRYFTVAISVFVPCPPFTCAVVDVRHIVRKYTQIEAYVCICKDVYALKILHKGLCQCASPEVNICDTWEFIIFSRYYSYCNNSFVELYLQF